MPRFVVISMCLWLLSGTLTDADAQSSPPQVIDIGSRLELMVDKHLVDNLQSAELKLHPLEEAPASKQPGLEAGYTTVIASGDKFQMYGRGYMVPGAYWKNVGIEAGRLNEVTLYAESRDGIHWTYPDLGLFKIENVDERLLKYAQDNSVKLQDQQANIVMAGKFSASHNFTPFIDTRPGVPSEERYKAVGGNSHRPEHVEKYGPGGMFGFVSPDGIHWKQVQELPIIPNEWGKFDSQNLVFWSELEGQYVAYFRHFAKGRRAIRRSTSPDFMHWSEPVEVNANLPGEQLYTSNVHPYFRAPHIYLAPATRYIDGQRPNTFVILMSSRDGVNFDRTFGQQLFKKSLGGDRTNYLAWTNGAQTGPRELSFYDHSQHRYTLRLDGFGSVHADAEQGEMLTRPFRFDGQALKFNFRTADQGAIRVELQTAAGKPIPGFTLADSQPLQGDEIEQVVSWKAGSDVSPWIGKPIRLRVVLNHADLYALSFGPNP